jgi:hypothetical protein
MQTVAGPGFPTDHRHEDSLGGPWPDRLIKDVILGLAWNGPGRSGRAGRAW